MNKKDTSNNKIQEINKNYLLKLFDFEALDKKKLIKNLEIGPEGFIIKNLRLYPELLFFGLLFCRHIGNTDFQGRCFLVFCSV